jgi:hypothetical protein
MSLPIELATFAAQHFVALILDNEVTVGEFVVAPPLPWVRLTQTDGTFRVPSGYSTLLTPEQARHEMRNRDKVSLPAIVRALPELCQTVAYVLIGNNAAQGLPLAQHVPPPVIAARAAIVYATTLPQQPAYQDLGYCTFVPRRQAVAHLLALAQATAQPLALCFVNTIQHDESNYHDP